MPQGLIGSNTVLVPATDLFSFDDLPRFEVGDNPLNGTLGNANL